MIKENLKNKFRYSFFNSLYKDQVIKLLSLLWGRNTEESRLLFEWKYEQNPFSKYPFCFVVLDEELVAGFRGYLIQEFLFNDESYQVAALSDTITHPAYRRMGLFENLTQFSIHEISKINEIKCISNLSASWPPTGGYLKLGWQPVGSRHSLYMINIKEVFKRYFSKKDSHFIIIPSIREMNENNLRIQFEISGKLLPTEVSELFLKAEGTHRAFRNRKSSVYYSWRYQNPVSKYIFNYLWIGRDLGGFVALNHAGRNYWVIVDFLYSKESYLALILREIKAVIKPLLLSVWTLSQPGESLNIYKKSGFKDYNILLKRIKHFNHPPALIRPSSFNIQPEDWHINDLDIRNETNWLLFRIDSDSG